MKIQMKTSQAKQRYTISKARQRYGGHEEPIGSVCFPDGSACNGFGVKQQYTISKARQRLINLTIRIGYSASAFPDNSMLATGDRATIYDLKSKTKIHEWTHKYTVNSVCFS